MSLINFRFIEQEIGYIAAHSYAKTILHGPQFTEIVGRSAKTLTNVAFTMKLDMTSADEPPAFEAPTAEETSDIARLDPGMQEYSFINYTSGTTEKPKGVIVTHYNCALNQVKLVMDLPLRTEQT